jgi:hypothetical protein
MRSLDTDAGGRDNLDALNRRLVDRAQESRHVVKFIH